MPTEYNEQEKKDLEFFLERKAQLEQARTQSGMEQRWRQADADYEPHQLGGPIKKTLVENERTEVSSFVNLDKDQWRSKEAKNDPYIKIQTALSILFDRNPEAIFDPAAKRYEANTKLIEQLYHRSWIDVNIGAKKELRKFIFNLAKYGWSPARRYYKKIIRKDMQAIKKFNLETNKFEYEKKDMVDIDDVYFEAKSPYDCWVDDMARPDEPRSRRDWMWREVYDKTTFRNLFEDKKNAGEVQFSSKSELADRQKNYNYVTVNRFTSTDLADVYFYENRVKDKWLIVAGGILLESTPLPRDDKELSLVDTYWTLRSTDSPYGIGINEIMRSNKILLDRVRNMTVDQVVLSIYKMFFYSNVEQLDDEGGEQIRLEPGRGKKVIDPKNIAWLEIPGPGRDAYQLVEMLGKDIEDDTGITKTLEGEITGKTAFEISQAQQGALKRLTMPLRNIKAALEWDAKLCVNTMKMIYSVPKVYNFVDPELITEYVANVEDDKERYFVDPDGTFNALKYREFQLNLEKDQSGNFQGAQERQFFQVKPSYLDWEGEITIRVESMIEQSKPLEQQKKLEMINILLPLYGQMAVNPILLNVYKKPVKEILKLYEEDPKSWLPEEWLTEQPMMSFGMQSLSPRPTFQAQAGLQMQEPQKVVPSMELSQAGTEFGAVNQL